MKKFKSGRHTPAFLLLFLAKSPNYGGQLLKMCEENLFANSIDSAILYRTLNNLEENGAICAYWESDNDGNQRKWYKLTELGWQQLAEFYEDIKARQRNLDYFIHNYEKLEWDEK
ncbi:PadR family transcriptional regulator [Neobacillus sp. LXY-4]|uniref:PadR family transcriptional regulator n=1 Tax=Neobacillus sp. LXY-4 TaxID=3379826 RepID=UPI003EE10889